MSEGEVLAMNVSMKILIVDDMADNVELLVQILEDDYAVITASSGQEYLEKAASESPNLILLDINMPAMVVKGLEMGAFDYLSKLVRKVLLLAKVRVVNRIKQTDEMLTRSQKRDALGKLISGIAHDYNNMLGVIMGSSELLEQDLEPKSY